MRRRGASVRLLLVFGVLVGVAAAPACSSDTSHAVRPGDGGEAGSAGDTSAAGEAETAAGQSSAAGSGTSGAQSAGGDGGFGGEITLPGSDAGAPSDAGAAGAVDQPAQSVTAFGCFGRSGDGLDVLANGKPAVLLTVGTPYAAPCGSNWISDNEHAFAPAQPPTTIVMRRKFVVDSALLQSGTFTVSFKADDAVELIFNGHSVASCTPPDLASNAGACQEACSSTTLPSALLLGDGQINTLEIRLINLQSVPVDGTNFGYTAVSFEMCVAPPID